MHPKKIEYLASKIDLISKSLIAPHSNPEERYRLMSYDNDLFMLMGEPLLDYEDVLLDLLEEENWENKFSEKYIERKLRELTVRNHVEDGFNLQKNLSLLCDEYAKYDRKHQVYVPLVGVKARDEPLKIGNVEIILMTKELKKGILNRIISIVMASISSEDDKKFTNNYLEENFSMLQDKSFSVYEVIAEPIRARERAEDETRRAIDLLRFAVPALYSNDHEVKIGMLGDVPQKSIKLEPTIATDNSKFSLNKEVAGPKVPFHINQKNIDKMKNIGVFKLSEILQKPLSETSKMESALLRGVHWLANSTIDNERENSFLNLIVCLETFLTPGNRDPIASSIGEGVAFALADDLDNRKSIKKKVKGFYNKRSGISHGGDKSVHLSELIYLQRLTISFTIWLIKKIDDFESVNDLLNWVEEQKLS